MVEEKKLVEDLFKEVHNDTGKGVYGMSEVIELLMGNVVQTVLITDNIDLHRIEGKCGGCGNVQEDIVQRSFVIPKKTEYNTNPCIECNTMNVVVTESDIVDYLQTLSSKFGVSP